MARAAATSAAVSTVRSCWGKDHRSAVAAMSLMLLGDPFPQKSVGTEHQNQDQDGEDDSVGPSGGDELVAPGGQHADQQSSERRSWHVADPSEDGGGERPQSRLISH